jgi:pyrimidine-specific ribonucleoside hydrolase
MICAAALSASGATPVIIDTDMGSDDVMAISFLLAHRDVPIEAITVVDGLAHVPAGAANARRLLHAAGRDSVPVYEGREVPLQSTAGFPKEWRVASDAPVTAYGPASPKNQKRVEAWLAQRLKDTAHPVRILALGPLTNIALAVENAKPNAIEEIVIMGGAFHVAGNLGDGGAFKTDNKTAEWNFFVDPEAAARVFRSGVPIRVVPLDATNKVKILSTFASQFRQKARGPLAEIVVKVLAGDQDMIDKGLFYAWDPLAAAVLLDRSIVTWTSARVTIRTSGNEAGRSVIEKGTPNASLALDGNTQRFEAGFLKAFAR